MNRFADWIDYPKEDRLLMKHSSQVWSVVVSSDGCFLFGGLKSGWIVMMDLRTDEVIREWRAHSNSIRRLVFHSSGVLGSGSSDYWIRLWDTLDGCKYIRSGFGHSSRVLSLTFNREATQIVSGADDKTVRLWSVQKGECVREFRGHSGSVYSCLLIGDWIITGSKNREIRVWKTDESECIRVIGDGAHGCINDLRINSDHSLIAALFDTGFTLFKWPGMEIIRTIKHSAFYGQFHPIHPHLLAVGERKDGSSSVKVFDVISDGYIHSFEEHAGYLTDLCFTPDRCQLISASTDRTIRIWDTSKV